MSQLTPADVKKHCVIGDDFTEDDTLLQDYIDAAERHVQNHVRRDLDAEFPDGWPANIVQAVRMLVAHFYTNREATIVAVRASKIPLSVEALLECERSFS